MVMIDATIDVKYVCVCFQIHDGNSSSAPELVKLCGSQLPSTINSTGNELYIKLRTDSSINTGGFLASYSSSTYSTHRTLQGN